MAFPVKADRTLGEGKVFFDAAALIARTKRTGNPDGMKVDKQGNLFATGPGGVLIFSPEGKHLGTILTGQATSNVAWATTAAPSTSPPTCTSPHQDRHQRRGFLNDRHLSTQWRGRRLRRRERLSARGESGRLERSQSPLCHRFAASRTPHPAPCGRDLSTSWRGD
jgi:hypothetical protein